MAIKKTSKEEILKNSIKLFKINGYYNTSMANIANECGLIKGSIYHHFKSKEEIGLESLKYIHKYFNDHIYSVVYKDDLSDKEKIELFVKKIDDYFLHSEGGCLLGNLALEVSSENVAFKDEIRAYFLAWEKALIHLLKNHYEQEKAQELSKEYVALTQGAIMMMTLYNETSSYLKVGQKIINLI
jgi:TetR/AcrR family transcriptional repressor of lmrAB and yxaGH operons